jgi:hypothetical protein
MSNGLIKLALASNLMKCLGLQGREKFKFSLDGECIVVPGRIINFSDFSTEELIEEASGAKKAKYKKTVTSRVYTITPAAEVNFGLSSKASSIRLLVQPNPTFYAMGIVQCPQIVEPTMDDNVILRLTVNPKVVDFEELLKVAFRFYALT